ncbi:MAG: hypothetical protein HYV09_38755 [Deltaproteobacteria bacterium]|nr:hypothetical protein [Deltaproteobacteria bacterium]
MRRSFRSVLSTCAALVLLQVPFAGCSSEPSYTAPDRLAGERAPRTAKCDDEVDPTGCLLPWPSSVFTRRDPSSPTGVRLSVDLTSLGPEDDATWLNRADGFSRLTPIVTAFDTELDASAPDAIRLFLAEPGRAHEGEAVPLRVSTFPSSDEAPRTLLVATPKRLLEPNAEYLVVVTDALRAKGGGAIAPERPSRVSLGLEKASSQPDADLHGHHAPARALLRKAGVDASRVLRMWTFTTRSVDDGTRRLRAMLAASRAAVSAGRTKAIIDKVKPGSGSVALDIEGRLGGLPAFASASGIELDAEGLPVESGTRDAPFRVALPKGSGDYRFVMYGHGTGGEFRDTAFDEELAKEGIAKVGIQFHGWTTDEALATFLNLKKMFTGTQQSSAWLMQAVADGAAIQAAMTGAIGEALAAATLGGAANPAAGRKPDGSIAVWAGGSLGGTMGLVFTAASPEIRAAVLNVPGAGWTHFIPESVLYPKIKPFIVGGYGYDLGVLQAMFMNQSNWDDIDGGIWKEALADRKVTFLVQESIGDTVLPNVGTENVARTTGSVQLGSVLAPIEGVGTTAEAEDLSALTQYKVPPASDYDVHGFAAKDTPAGIAARDQIRAFVASVFAGKPRIVVPPGCAGGSCDFSK